MSSQGNDAKMRRHLSARFSSAAVQVQARHRLDRDAVGTGGPRKDQRCPALIRPLGTRSGQEQTHRSRSSPQTHTNQPPCRSRLTTACRHQKAAPGCARHPPRLGSGEASRTAEPSHEEMRMPLPPAVAGEDKGYHGCSFGGSGGARESVERSWRRRFGFPLPSPHGGDARVS